MSNQAIHISMSIPPTGAHPLGDKRSRCTGCAACAACCPVACITMRPDHEGFRHPEIEESHCTKCGLCTRICPAFRVQPASLNDALLAAPAVYAVWNLDSEIRRLSSSGGVFSALAENILSRNGVVVGAAFDDQFVVRHILIESAGEIPRLRGSKYVQSEVPPSLYLEIWSRLKQGQTVLFSGTPCQVAGLRGFLPQPYERLFCCDLVCHGVPSPSLLARYTQAKQRSGRVLKAVYFRDKVHGWKKYGMRFVWQDGETYAKATDSYLMAFLRNYALRPCCFECAYANTQRQGDLTLADFWSVAERYPDYDRDDKGTSLVLVNTNNGREWLDECRTSLFCGAADLDTAIAGNHLLVSAVRRPSERETFFHDLNSLTFEAMIRKYRLHDPGKWRIFWGSTIRIVKAVRRRLLRLDAFGGGR
jgi:coenzyme F420-reducing hydrogenase beta subunit